MFGKDVLNPVQEGDVTVGSQEGGANIPVFRENGENVLDEREAVFIEWTYRMGMDPLRDLPGQFVISIFHHVLDIRIVQIEGGAVDIHFFYEFLDCDLF